MTDQPNSAASSAEAVIRTAACHRPQQLKLKLLLMLEALVLHHEALLSHGFSNVQDIAETDCPDCHSHLPECLEHLGAISADIGVLQSLHDQLMRVDCDFPRAEPPFFKAAADMMRELANGVDISDARGRLERLMSHPTTPDDA